METNLLTGITYGFFFCFFLFVLIVLRTSITRMKRATSEHIKKTRCVPDSTENLTKITNSKRHLREINNCPSKTKKIMIQQIYFRRHPHRSRNTHTKKKCCFQQRQSLSHSLTHSLTHSLFFSSRIYVVFGVSHFFLLLLLSLVPSSFNGAFPSPFLISCSKFFLTRLQRLTDGT